MGYSSAKEEEIKQNNEEIEIFRELAKLTKDIIIITEHRDKYGNKRPLSDFIEELQNHINTYEFSIKERLFSNWKLEKEK